jgi:hypothetical protein
MMMPPSCASPLQIIMSSWSFRFHCLFCLVFLLAIAVVDLEGVRWRVRGSQPLRLRDAYILRRPAGIWQVTTCPETYHRQVQPEEIRNFRLDRLIYQGTSIVSPVIVTVAFFDVYDDHIYEAVPTDRAAGQPTPTVGLQG